MDKLTARWRALDDLRGLTILLMIPVNAMMEFTATPAWFRHAPGPGLTLADAILPAFLFAMGLSASFSLKRRIAEQGRVRTLFHGLARYTLLFGIGTIGYFLVWRQSGWEVLQLLGLAGGFAFCLMFLPVAWRLAAAVAVLGFCEIARPWFLQAQFEAWYPSGIGGPWGFLPFSVLPLAASALGERLRRADTGQRIRVAQVVGIASLAGGIAWSLAVSPPDKHLVSSAYLLIGFGLASLALSVMSALEPHVRMPALSALGRNPLLMYLLSGVLILPIRAWVAPGIPLWEAWAWGVAVLVACAAIAWVMDRRRWYLKL